jgi:ATP-dependent exoDNAse (exonuclease V) alpha subunit
VPRDPRVFGDRVMRRLKSEDEMGLVNGSMGAIYDITWEDYGQFDEYTGPAFPTL